MVTSIQWLLDQTIKVAKWSGYFLILLILSGLIKSVKIIILSIYSLSKICNSKWLKTNQLKIFTRKNNILFLNIFTKMSEIVSEIFEIWPYILKSLYSQIRPFNEYLHAGDKSPMQKGFFNNSTGDLLPALSFLGRLYNFCNFGIIFSSM